MIPEISIVMSVYNGEQYLREAIESILNQTFRNFEFIIVDDGSTDRSNEIVKSYTDPRIVFIEQCNTGLATALNNGIRIAKSQFIARMDADDVSMPNRLETQYNFLKNNPEYILVGSNVEVIDMDGEFVYNSNLPSNWNEIKSRFPDTSFYHSSVIYSLDAFKKAGGYFSAISKMNCFEDAVLWNRMQYYGCMTNIQARLLKYRLVPTASTTKSGFEETTLMRILKEIVTNNELSDENKDTLFKIKQTLSKTDKEQIYYIHLAKKYLFNNYSPPRVRINVRLAIKINPKKVNPYLLYILSFCPYSLIKILYSIKKA